MFRKFLLVLAVCLLATSITLAGTRAKIAREAKADQDNGQNSSVVFHTQGSYSKAAAVTYVAIDTMTNGFGPANTGVNPIAYDPYSKVVAMVHRSFSTYGGGSGGIFYNYSTNQGTAWQKRVGHMAAGLGANTNGRYPSMTLSNGTKTANKDSVLVEVQFPLLVGGAFGGLIYSVDPGVGAASPIAAIDTAGVAWTSQFRSWASTNSNHVWMSSFNGFTGKLTTFLTSSDGITFTKSNPKQFADSVYGHLGTTYYIADYFGTYRNSTTYAGNLAHFAYAAATDTATYTLGISSSTDKGTTWSNLDVVNWHTLTGFATGKIGSNDSPTQPSSNAIAVDSAGGIHWAALFIDTTTTPNKWSVYDIYKAVGGSWAATKVRDMQTHENYYYGSTLNQTGIELETAVSQNGNYVVFKWIEDGQGASFKDSVAIPDVWVSVWNKAKKTWTTPANVTASASVVDQVTHVAPICDNDGTIYLMRNMESPSVAGSNPLVPNENNATINYFAKYTINPLTGVIRKDVPVAGTFELQQNYPNPFNPATQISFTLPVSGETTLKVYNMLGQEVASLLSGFKQAGSYFVEFNASKLASGVYLYRLQSGSFSSTKKMVLMK